jgi:hypothetical protein
MNLHMQSSYPLRSLRAAALLLAAFSLPASAQNQDALKKDEKPPSEADMMAMMMELAQPGPNHKLLLEGAGTWTYTMKFWMDPSAPPSESSGSATYKAAMGGRYLIGEFSGKMQMPGPDGKLADVEFKGMGIEGYDNVMKRFVSSWIDNMGTGIMNAEGTYDSTAKKLTYHAEYESLPGMKNKIREVLTIVDKDNRTFEFFENRGGQEVRTMEIKYKRKS